MHIFKSNLNEILEPDPIVSPKTNSLALIRRNACDKTINASKNFIFNFSKKQQILSNLINQLKTGMTIFSSFISYQKIRHTRIILFYDKL